MLINVLVIVLKVFWIEVALFWRDIVTPYRIQNGEYQVQDSLHQERFHSDYGFFVYWWYAAKPYFVFFVTPSVRSLSLHRSFFMLLPLLLVPLTFISNLLLGGITILSESLMTDSAQGPHVSTFWKICVDKTLWRDNSKIILDFSGSSTWRRNTGHMQIFLESSPHEYTLTQTLPMQEKFWWHGNICLHLKGNMLGLSAWRCQLAGGCLTCGEFWPLMKFDFSHYWPLARELLLRECYDFHIPLIWLSGISAT